MDFLAYISGCFHDITLSHGLVLSLLLAGLVGSLAHCTPMCGPFVLAQSGHLSRLSDSLLLPYHLGRITTYIVLAALFHSVLNLALLFLPQRALLVSPLLAFAGTLFLISAFPSLQKVFPWAARLHVPMPRRFVSLTQGITSHVPAYAKPYLMGVMLGFMPCGLVTAALMAASTAPDLTTAALAMASFGLGTMPALITISLGGKVLAQKYPMAAKRASQGLVVWSGLWLFVMAGILFI